MSGTLEIYLIMFLSITLVLLVIISIFVIKLILELSKLANNLNDITSVVKCELEPTLVEFKNTLTSVNLLVTEADKKVSDFKSVVVKILGAGSAVVSGLKGLTGSFWKGMSAGMNMFKRNK